MLRFLRDRNKHTKTIWWVLIIITVATFLGGFVFLFGAGLDSSHRASAGGAIGTVNGEPITRDQFQAALNDQREQFKRQYGTEPQERDLKLVESQAWRGLVAQRLMAAKAKELGLRPNDREVVLTLENSPPAQVATNAAFQTDGRFDAEKYKAALRDPNNNWSGFESLIRDQLPVRKLQERLLSSIKLSEPELRESFRDRNEALDGVVLQIVPTMAEKISPPTPADLDRAYNQYKSRFYAGTRVELEALTVPKKFADEDKRAARTLADGLVERARRGEDFAALARDYSEGPGADKGGVIDRVFQPGDLGPQLGVQMLALKPGDVTPPYEENGRIMILKLLERVPDPRAPMPGMKLAQIMIKVHPNENSLRDQYEALEKIRVRALQLKSLGKAAVEKGLATAKTGFFDANSNPPALIGAPEAIDWGLSAKQGAISNVFEGVDEFVVAQVSARHESGMLSKDELAANQTLSQIAEVDARVTALKGKADQVKAALDAGQPLEAAAKSVGLTAAPVTHMTRVQPDPRLAQVPGFVGAMFNTPEGRSIGPVREVNGWYFARIEHRINPVAMMYDSTKGQLSSDILRRRQQNFFTGWLGELQAKARVQDLRNVANSR
jgi:peptidyl-prolyl cis-trans isomerase D